jgi:hypothetical protein
VDNSHGRKDVVARAARAVREDKSTGANFGNLSVLGETDLLQSILINGLMGVGVPRCWCSSVTEKNCTSNSTSDSAKTSTKNHVFLGGFGTIGGHIRGTIE